MNFITLTIVALAAFIADKGATLDASSIKATPSNVVQMEGLVPTARFTSAPFLTASRHLKVKLSAYHPSGIAGVEFTCNGKSRLVRKTTPDRQGYYEYSYGIKAGAMEPGLYEVTARVIPNEGPALTLSGNSRDFEDIRNGYNGFWFVVGEKVTARVGPRSDFASINEAVEFHGEALSHGGTVRLDPGTYALESLRLDNGDTTMTIDGRGKATLVNPGNGPSIDAGTSLHFTGCDFLMSDEKGRFFKGGRDARLVLTDCRVYSENPDGYRKQVQYLGKSYPAGLNYGIWLEDVLIENVWKGCNGVNTAKRVTVTRNTGDAFGSSPGAVIDSAVLNPVKDETFHGQHCDIIQISTGVAAENRIYADIFAPKQQAQIGHFSRTDTMKNIAFVNWIVDAREAPRAPDLNLNPSIDGLYIENLWFFGGSLNWADGQHTNVSVRGCVFNKQTIDKFPFDDYSDIEIRFTDRMGSDWGAGCSLGPIEIFDDYTWEVSP